MVWSLISLLCATLFTLPLSPLSSQKPFIVAALFIAMEVKRICGAQQILFASEQNKIGWTRRLG